MGALKILVLCALFFVLVVLSEGAMIPQVKTTTDINARCKRETEIDVHARESRPKVPCRKPTKLLIPITKNFNPKPHNALPRRYMVPVVTKPKVLNITENEIKQPEVAHTIQTNDSKSNNDTKLDTTESNEPTQAVNLTTIDYKNKDDESKDEVVKEKCAEDNSDLKTVDKDIHNDEEDKKERIDEKQIEAAPKIVADTKNKNIKNQIANTEVNQVPTKEVKTPVPNSVKQLTSTNILNNYKVVPGVLIQSKKKPSKIGNKSKPFDEEGRANSDVSNIDAFTEPLNEIINNTEAQEIGDQIPKMVSLSILTDKGKIPLKMVPRINPLQTPFTPKTAMKETNESALLPQINGENQIKIMTEKPELNTSVQAPKTEQEEIIIQNNNYEELYESSAPEYTTPKLITSDLRFAPNMNNLNTIPSQYEKHNTPQTYEENKPFSYDVTKYPNEYVVNAYEDIGNTRQHFDYSLDPINQDFNAKQKYTKTASPWPSQRYNSLNQPETQDFGEKLNTENINQRQEYPKIIWRSWKNNQIYIRPKYGNGVNTELYKGLGRYLANVNAQSAAFNSNAIGSRVYENQSTSPCINRF